jgi:hypothetical protein
VGTVLSVNNPTVEPSEDFKEYLRIEAEILSLVNQLEAGLGEGGHCEPGCQASVVLKSAYTTLGKAQAAAAGVLPIWDTDWDLYSTQESLRKAVVYCQTECLAGSGIR